MKTHPLYHVWVIPSSGPRGWLQIILVVGEPLNNALHAVPRILDIVVIPPQVTDITKERVVHLVGPGKKKSKLRTKLFTYVCISW